MKRFFMILVVLFFVPLTGQAKVNEYYDTNPK